MIILALLLASPLRAQQALPAFDQSIPKSLTAARPAPPLNPLIEQALAWMERDPEEKETVAFLKAKGVAITFGDTQETAVTGVYDPFTKSIKVSRSLSGLDPLFIAPTIVHEAQHARWHLSGYPLVFLDAEEHDLALIEDEDLAYLREQHFTDGVIKELKAKITEKSPWVTHIGSDVNHEDLLQAVDPSNLLFNHEVYVRSRDQYLASRRKPYLNAYHVFIDQAIAIARGRLQNVDGEYAARHAGDDKIDRAQLWLKGMAPGPAPAMKEKDAIREQILNSLVGMMKTKEYYQAELRKDDDWRARNLPPK